MKQRQTSIKNERGVAFAYTALTLVVFLGLAALAVDTAHIALTANEVQIAADAAATSGAISLFRSPITMSGNGAAREGADKVLQRNVIEREPANDWETSVNVEDFDTGDCDLDAGGTGSTLSGQNAVTARVTAEVPTFLAGIFGVRTSRVTRKATAAFQPSLPPPDFIVAACSGVFTNHCFRKECLPEHIDIPGTKTAWTSYTSEPTVAANFIQYLDECCGGGRKPDPLHIGDSINLDNNLPPVVQTEIIDKINQMVPGALQLGVTQYTVPVLNCPGGKIAGSTVVGMMTIVVEQINPSGFTGLRVRPIFDDMRPAPDGGCNFSTGYVKLVE